MAVADRVLLRHLARKHGGLVVPRPLPLDGHGPDGAAQGVQGPEILDAQGVVGPGQDGGVRAQEPLRRPLPGGGEGQAPIQLLLQQGGILPPVQTGGHPPQLSDVPTLTAKGQHIHHPGGVQDGYRPSGKGLRRGHGPHRGQLQHQIYAPHQGQPGPRPLVRDGAVRLLHPVAAHHSHRRQVRPQQLPGTGQLERVAGVKGVVFRNDPDGPHGVFSFSKEIGKFFAKKGCLSPVSAVKWSGMWVLLYYNTTRPEKATKIYGKGE